MLLPVSVYFIILYGFDCCPPFPPPSFLFRCVAHSLSLSPYLGCLALLIWLPFFRSLLICFFFLPYAYYIPGMIYGCPLLFRFFFVFCFLFFSSESLPCDDVLCRLLSRPLPSVCFVPCLFVLFCFLRPCPFPVCFGVTPSTLWPQLDS